MSDSLTDLILSLTPEDGSSIGNGAMMALVREPMLVLFESDHFAARYPLVADGLLAKSRERGPLSELWARRNRHPSAVGLTWLRRDRSCCR